MQLDMHVFGGLVFSIQVLRVCVQLLHIVQFMFKTLLLFDTGRYQINQFQEHAFNERSSKARRMKVRVCANQTTQLASFNCSLIVT